MVSDPVERSQLLRWILLDGNRLVLAGLISGGIFLACVALAQVGLVPVLEAGPLTTVTAGLVGGTLPFITIVLAINQLVLSQELGWVGTLRERMEGMQEFRRDVETLTEIRVSPAAPAEFLRTLVRQADSLVQMVAEHCEEIPDSELQEDIDELTDMIEPRSARVATALKHAEFGTFNALSASLDYNTGQYLYFVRHLQATHSDMLPSAAEETLEDLSLGLVGQQLLESYLSVIGELTAQIETLEEVIEDTAASLEATQLLMTIPGVSFYSSLLITAEIGEIDRFDEAAEVVSYAGLNPVVRESPDSRTEGGISK